MEEQVSAIIHLGSNMGDRLANLLSAVNTLEEMGRVTARSSVYETAPWGNTDQPYFFNMAIELMTALDAGALFSWMSRIESSLGRTRTEKWGPRIIDLDIIFYGDEIIEEEDLVIPHPRAHERAFVLIPLLEICPERMHPKLDLTVWELYDRCTDVTEVYLPDVPL